MNRIYQGRVSKVQCLKPTLAGERPKAHGSKPEHWEDCPGGEEALWRHHELFQDAVNYYTLALAAMADGNADDSEKARAARGWSEQVRATWKTARRKAVEFPGPHHRIAPQLGLDPKITGFDDCARAVFRGSKATTPQKTGALMRLLELAAAGEAALNKLAVEKLPFLCSKPEFFAAGDDRTANEQLSQRQTHVRRIQEADPEDLPTVASLLELDCFLRTPPADHYTGEKAAQRLRDCFRHIAEDKPGKPARFPGLKTLAADFEATLKQLLAATPDALSMPQANKPPAEFHPTAIFKFLPNIETWDACKAATAGVLDRKVVAEMEADPLTAVRVDGQPVFDYFTNNRNGRPSGQETQSCRVVRVRPRGVSRSDQSAPSLFSGHAKTRSGYCQATHQAHRARRRGRRAR